MMQHQHRTYDWAIASRMGLRLLTMTLVALSGCSRAFYRQQADSEVYNLVAEKNLDPRWQLPNFDITPDPRSRHYDVTDPDCPPLTPDDPTAHKYMEVVYGMRGSDKWDALGQIDTIESPNWQAYMDPQAADEGRAPVVRGVTAIGAIELSLVHSREYQEQLENLYLAALAVTFERYQFDVRLTGILGNIGKFGEPGGEFFYQHQPTDQSNLKLSEAHIGISKLFPTGAQFVTELVNDTVWLFAGSNHTQSATTLTYSLIHPLLFAAGRDIALENLTQAERNLVYALRDFSRFRKEFFTNTITGGQVAGLQRFLRGFEFLASGGGGPSVGFYPTLLRLQQVRNLEENVRQVETLIEVLGAQGASALDLTQLESRRAGTRGELINSVRLYEDRLDQFRVQLGLPPDIDVTLDDSLLVPFQFTDPTVIAADAHLQAIGRQIRGLTGPVTLETLRPLFAELGSAVQNVARAVEVVRRDYQRLDEILPLNLQRLGERDGAELAATMGQDRRIFEEAVARFARVAAEIGLLRQRAEQADFGPQQLQALVDSLGGARNELLGAVQALSYAQLSARMELIPLQIVEADITGEVATALASRLDLMNRRANVVDARRRLEVVADALEANLDLVAEGALNTPPLIGNDNPFDFRAQHSEFRIGVAFTTPLDRRAERNNYRAAQIAYQRTRRAYMAAEDRIKLDVRQSVRTLGELAGAFEFERRSVRSTARIMFLAQTAQDAERRGLSLSSALRSLLRGQDDLIQIWLDYESTRLNLARDTGTMQIDERGIWIDPFYQQIAQPGVPPN